MDAFTYRNGELCAEGVALRALADQHGTPLYVYSQTHLQTQYRTLAQAMRAVKPLICFSVKANSNGAVMRTLLDEGSGLDIVSGGELYRARRAGADPARIVFAGVGKTADEIRYALRAGILFFTVESEPEARRISACAVETGTIGRIAFRINPDVDPQTHKYISTGKKENKFGLDAERTLKAYALAAQLPNIEIAGLHMHIGSQILTAQPFHDAVSIVREFCRTLKTLHPTFRYLDIGGGIGIRYKAADQPLDPATYAARVVPLLEELGLQIVMEPGRYLCGNAGVLVCRVQYVKDNAFKKFVVVDAGMNDLIRPSLYQAHHDILSVAEGRGVIHGDLVGPICESGDFLAADRDLPEVGEGDLLAVTSAGAYGFAMASTYNSRPLVAEVMVNGDRAWVVGQRETWEDLVRREPLPATA
ncbi:MAG: diaminopimelate decarboxylase [Lentisphaerae bacterium]|nr:diaminopimelate decarboxylase [Lentisphaerota bacterium]